MPKNKEYYPLTICKEVDRVINRYYFTPDEMKALTENLISKDAKEELVQRSLLRASTSSVIPTFKHFSDFTTENLEHLDFVTIVNEWSKNKQVYKPDNDFLQELMSTEKFHITKDMWNYLPCNTMYFDFDDCAYIRDNFSIKGIFVKVVKDTRQDSWEIHTLRMVDGCKFKDNRFYISNEDGDFAWDNMDEETKAHMKLLRVMCGDDYVNRKFKQAQDIIVVFQLLCYLSSIEPDIHENALTKTTYRPRNVSTPVKNKFSEVQQHDIGVRFGTAFRKYKKATESASTGHHHSSTSSKRPHYRRAHWSYYWYNVLDAKGETVYNVYGVPEKVKRPKWVEAVFVNDNYGQTDCVIHKVS